MESSNEMMVLELEPRYGSMNRCHDPLELLRNGVDFDQALMGSFHPCSGNAGKRIGQMTKIMLPR